MKEMYFAAGIEEHDLQTKVKKVKEFLAEKHPVKISVMAKRPALIKNPLAVEELILKVIEGVGDLAGNVQQTSGPSNKKDFVLSPK